MLVIGLITSVLISVCLFIYCIYLRKSKNEFVQINTDRINENKRIEQANEQLIKNNEELEQKKDNLIASIHAQDNILKSLSSTSDELRRNAESQAERDYEAKWKELQAKLEEQQNALSAEYKKQSDSIAEKIKQQQEKLNNIEAKQLAYIQAQQRQEEIAANQDYYRLALDKVDLDDISLLRELQPRFVKKESIDKLIWEVYFKPAYDILMSHLFEGTKKVCGIYKITDLTTGRSYIGQSVDIKERFRQHIKSALSYKITNMFYNTMQKSGVHNFTFEILEEVPRDKLNERETYWINFYKTKEFGLNSTCGGS